ARASRINGRTRVSALAQAPTPRARVPNRKQANFSRSRKSGTASASASSTPRMHDAATIATAGQGDSCTMGRLLTHDREKVFAVLSDDFWPESVSTRKAGEPNLHEGLSTIARSLQRMGASKGRPMRQARCRDAVFAADTLCEGERAF